MKKVLALVLCAVMLLALCACTKTSTNEQTVNGITKTTTTTTNGDTTTTEITYKDSNGNTLDPELGEAAFALAEAGDQNPLETAKANASGESAPAEATTEEATEEEPQYVATLTFSNEAEADINEIYLVLNEDTSWGSNLLDTPLEVGQTITYENALTYHPSTPFALDIVDADDSEATFSDFDFSGLSDPENIMITISLKENGDYTIRLK